MDDVTGEALGYLQEQLFKNGALDCWFTPIQMKKNRPAIQLSVLCKPNKTHALARRILSESPALGVRIHSASRMVLERRRQTVATEYGLIRIKTREDGRIKPEFEDLRKAAEAHAVPLWQVDRAARQAAQEK